jgi:hypothetical protein
LSIAAALDKAVTARVRVCAMGRWIADQSDRDQGRIDQWIVAGDGSLNELHGLLAETGGLTLSRSALHNHVAGRCGCK